LIADSNQKAPTFGNLVWNMVKRRSNRNKDLQVPWALAWLCDAFTAMEGWSTEGVFRKNGSVIRMNEAKAALKEGRVPDTNLQVHDLAGLIKALFREQTEGILFLIRKTVHALVSKTDDLKFCEMAVGASLLLLPRPKLDAITYFLGFFIEGGQHDSQATMMTNESLAIVFAPNFFHSEQENDNTLTEEMRALELKATLILVTKPWLCESRSKVNDKANSIPEKEVEKLYKEIVPNRKRSATAERAKVLMKSVKALAGSNKRSAEDNRGGAPASKRSNIGKRGSFNLSGILKKGKSFTSKSDSKSNPLAEAMARAANPAPAPTDPTLTIREVSNAAPRPHRIRSRGDSFTRVAAARSMPTTVASGVSVGAGVRVGAGAGASVGMGSAGASGINMPRRRPTGPQMPQGPSAASSNVRRASRSSRDEVTTAGSMPTIPSKETPRPTAATTAVVAALRIRRTSESTSEEFEKALERTQKAFSSATATNPRDSFKDLNGPGVRVPLSAWQESTRSERERGMLPGRPISKDASVTAPQTNVTVGPRVYV
jgi:hypothetical protein